MVVHALALETTIKQIAFYLEGHRFIITYTGTIDIDGWKFTITNGELVNVNAERIECYQHRAIA